MSEVQSTGSKTQATTQEELKDANTILGAGLGVGALGAAGALIAGAVCPICIVATPVLVGGGLLKRRRAKRQLNELPR